jgi:hypothetical protein
MPDLILDPGSVVPSEQFRTVMLPERTLPALMAACRESTATHVCLGGLSCSIAAAPIREAECLLETGDADVVLYPLRGYEWLELLAALPSCIWFRVPDVMAGALVLLRRDRLLREITNVGPHRPVDDVLAQLADAGCRIRISTRPGAGLTPGPLAAFALPPLVPQPGDRSQPGLERRVEFDLRRLPAVQSCDDFTALRAGLFQIHDALERSHSVAQSIEGRGRHLAGDYWHAIMHRREPDYDNARYWFRRVGVHPIHTELAAHAARILAAAKGVDVAHWQSRLGSPALWNAAAFVDLCECAAADEDRPVGQVARRIQWTEMLLLLVSTCHDAFGTQATADQPRSPPNSG